MANIKTRLDKLETSMGVNSQRTICYEAPLSTAEAEHERFLHEAVPDFCENDKIVWLALLGEDRPPRLISITPQC